MQQNVYLLYVLDGISLGECLTTTTTTTTNCEEHDEDDNNGNSNGIRFCAIDWHSLDRTDKSHKMSLFVVYNTHV
jgi:hypothetical protein